MRLPSCQIVSKRNNTLKKKKKKWSIDHDYSDPLLHVNRKTLYRRIFFDLLTWKSFRGGGGDKMINMFSTKTIVKRDYTNVSIWFISEGGRTQSLTSHLATALGYWKYIRRKVSDVLLYECYDVNGVTWLANHFFPIKMQTLFERKQRKLRKN